MACSNLTERPILRLEVSGLSHQENVVTVVVLPFSLDPGHPLCQTNNLYVQLVPYVSDSFVAPCARYHLHLRKDDRGFSGAQYTFTKPTHLQTSIALRFFDDSFAEIEVPPPSVRLGPADFSVVQNENTVFFSPSALPRSRIGDRLVWVDGSQRTQGIITEAGSTVVARMYSDVHRRTSQVDITLDQNQVSIIGDAQDLQSPLVLADYWSRPELREIFEQAVVRQGVRLKKKINKKTLRFQYVTDPEDYSVLLVNNLVNMSFTIQTRSI